MNGRGGVRTCDLSRVKRRAADARIAPLSAVLRGFPAWSTCPARTRCSTVQPGAFGPTNGPTTAPAISVGRSVFRREASTGTGPPGTKPRASPLMQRRSTPYDQRVSARTLTVLFTDLAGSTEAWSGLDRVAADRRRSRHFGIMRNEVAANDGREVKSLGDGLMCTFASVGTALSCAGGMQRAFQAATRGGEPMLGLRAGLATGDVTEEDGDAFGVPVIIASRLCALAESGQVLLPAGMRDLLGPAAHALRDAGVLELKGIGTPLPALELAWEQTGGEGLRVVLADDATLVREGLARLLESEGIEVVAQVADGPSALAAVQNERPHVAVLDIRMPPRGATEGLRVAEELLANGTQAGIILLSTHLNAEYARTLVAAAGGRGVGYLAKERVSDIDEFAGAIRAVAAGGTAFDASFDGLLGQGSG